MIWDKLLHNCRIYVLKARLEGSDPPIWRRFQISGSATLGDLHYTLQIVMGWTNSHLHEFHIGGRRYGAFFSDDDPEPVNDEDDFELRGLLRNKTSKFKYIYDFGDHWMHEIIVEDIIKAQPGVRYPICVEGERRCPPDDCGGIEGYYDIMAIIQDPSHEEYETYRDWLPEGFDPGAFSVSRTNDELGKIEAWREMAEDGLEHVAYGEIPEAFDYEMPVAGLLSLGEPLTESDHEALGIGPQHVPDLIRMATDMALHRARTESPVIWAPVHAWRILGQLQAPAAIEPLVDLLRLIDEDDDDWASEDLPPVLGGFGAPALPALSRFLRDKSRGIWARIAASSSLGEMAQRYPETRAACVAVLTEELERFAEADHEFNGFLIWTLVDLEAVESAPVMEQAFAVDAVDVSLLGDWEETQIELGLLDERSTPMTAKGRFSSGLPERHPPRGVRPPSVAPAKKHPAAGTEGNKERMATFLASSGKAWLLGRSLSIITQCIE